MKVNFTNLLLNVCSVAVTVAVVSVAGARISEGRRPLTAGRQLSERLEGNWKLYSTRGIRVGAPNARVTVVEFSDFQCPFCRRAADDLRELRRTFPNDVELVYRHFPLHKHSVDAAIAAECASHTGNFEALHDALFEQPDSIGVKSWIAFARDAGIRDIVGFERCRADPAVRKSVAEDSAAAIRFGVTGTPTILLNDRRFEANPGLARMRSVVEGLIR